MTIAEPTKIRVDPMKKYTFSSDLKTKPVNRATKNGYEISRIEAVEASSIRMLEKMKKLASAARASDRKIRLQSFSGTIESEVNTFFWRNTIGKSKMAVRSESMKSNASGDTPRRTFWSIVYTSPHVMAAAIAYTKPAKGITRL
jgi:hypothetical protein